jgi:hypothetical protein
MNVSELGNRVVHHWHGVNREADLAALADAVAASVEVFDDNGSLVRLSEDGKLVNINRADLQELIGKRICGMRAVNPEGTGWQREYFSYQFDPPPRLGPPTAANPRPGEGQPNNGPDAADLDRLYRTELLPRLPKVVRP